MEKEVFSMVGFEQGFCRTLSDIFSSAQSGLSDIAHVSIDVQDDYIYNARDEKIAEHIGKTIAPSFTRQGLTNYWVYFQRFYQRAPYLMGHHASRESQVGQFNRHIHPASNDIIIPKTEHSAIEGSHLHSILQGDEKNTVILTGFTFPVCVMETTLDLRRLGYRVALLRDGIDYDPCLDFVAKKLEASGAVITDTADVFGYMARLER